jgi:hypothetical protein
MSINDLVTVGGANPPTLLFGDGSAIEIMSFYVTSFSAVEDWFRGVRRYNHTYKTPNFGWSTNPDGSIVHGVPWTVTFAGCCRINATENDPNSAFQLVATVDLELSTGSVFFQSPSLINLHGTPDGTERCMVPGQQYQQAQAVCFRIHAATAACGARAARVGAGRDYYFAPATLTLGGGQLVVSEDGTFLVPTSLIGTGLTTLFANAPRLLHVLATVRQAGTAGPAGAPDLSVQVDFLLHIIPRHRCLGRAGFCDPALPANYTGTPVPYMDLPMFPGVGYGWDPAAGRPAAPPAGYTPLDGGGAAGGGAGQTAAGTVVAYAGAPVTLVFAAAAAWCQSAEDDATLLPGGNTTACRVSDSVQ